MLDVGCYAAGLWAKRRPQNLNRPLPHHGGGNDGDDDGVSGGSRDRGRLRRGKSHARAHSLDKWSTFCLLAGGSHPHHNDCRPADSRRVDLEDSLSSRPLRRRDEIG